MSDENEAGEQRASQIAMGDKLREAFDPMFKREGIGYAFVIWTPGMPGFARFVSNREQPEVTRTLKEVVIRLEHDEIVPDPGEPES